MIEIKEKKDYRLVTNEMRLEFAAVSDNEAFARMAVAAFIAPLNPTLEELSDELRAEGKYPGGGNR